MIRSLKNFFSEDPRSAAAVYLFGSVARGTARSDSDIDVGVLFQEDPPKTLDIIQAMLDIASHIVSDERLGKPKSNRDPFDLLARNGWLTPELRKRIVGIVGFRNVVVHSYDQVDLAVARRVMEDHREDVDRFVGEIRKSHPGLRFADPELMDVTLSG